MNIINITTDELGNDVIAYEDGSTLFVYLDGTSETFDAAGNLIEGTGIIGTESDDKLHGTNADDTIFALGGDDKITAGGGNDLVDGGSGSDVVLAGGGDDIARWVFADTLEDEVASLDYYNGGGVNSTQGNDILIMEFTSAQLIALDLTIQEIEDFFVNNSGRADFRLLSSQLTLVATNFETISINVTGVPGQTIVGSDGVDTLIGGAGDDVLIGGLGADILDGKDGGDTYEYIAGDGNDIITDTGTDTAVDTFAYDASTLTDVKIEISKDASNNVLVKTFEGDTPTSTVTLDGIEEIFFTGTDGVDIVTIGDLSGTDISNDSLIHDLKGGADELNASDHKGKVIITGGSGDDLIIGGSSDRDIAIYSGALSEYTVTLLDPTTSTFTVEHTTPVFGAPDDGTDTLTNIEFLKFSDGEFDINTFKPALKDIDIFVGNFGANKVYFNDGAGAFSVSKQAFSRGEDSFDVTLGDVDGDGDLDAFIANNFGANTVHLNNGDGTFSDSGQALGGSSNSLGVALADLDGDGDLDAFVANLGSPDKVYLNDGTGTFIDSGQALGGSFPSRDVVLGDLDGDGDVDAFIVSNFGANTVYLNNGDGTFIDSGQALGSFISLGVALADLDGDGDLDAFVANFDSPNKIYLNQGGIQGGTMGTFLDSGEIFASSFSTSVALGDLDGDGDVDAFVSNNGANKVYFNDGTGTFIDSGQALGSFTSLDVALADLDGDGDLDAVIANNGASNEIYFNDGTGTFGDPVSFGSSTAGSTSIALGDLDFI